MHHFQQPCHQNVMKVDVKMGESHNPAAFFYRCGNACGLSREKVTLHAEFIHEHSNIHDIVHVIFWYNLNVMDT